MVKGMISQGIIEQRTLVDEKPRNHRLEIRRYRLSGIPTNQYLRVNPSLLSGGNQKFSGAMLFPRGHAAAEFVEEVQQKGDVDGGRLGSWRYREAFAVGG